MIGTAWAAGAEHGDSMFADTHFWVAVAFFIFVALVARAAWRGITGMLDQRAVAITKQLDDAIKLRAEAEATLAEYKMKRDAAESEAKGILDLATAEATALRRAPRPTLPTPSSCASARRSTASPRPRPRPWPGARDSRRRRDLRHAQPAASACSRARAPSWSTRRSPSCRDGSTDPRHPPSHDEPRPGGGVFHWRMIDCAHDHLARRPPPRDTPWLIVLWALTGSAWRWAWSCRRSW